MEILELKIEMSGKAESNIVLYQESVLAQLEQIKNKKLVTDEDFSSAEKVVKICKEQETALADAKEKAQNKSASIKEVFAAISNAQNIFKETRLGLEKQIKAEKANRKQAIVDKAIKDFKEFTLEMLKRYDFKTIPIAIKPDVCFLEATKGKKNIDSMQKSVDLVLEEAKGSLNGAIAIKYSNLQIIKGRENQILFPDSEELANLDPDVLVKEIDKRETAHREGLEVIRQEEQEKLLKKQDEERENLDNANPEIEDYGRSSLTPRNKDPISSILNPNNEPSFNHREAETKIDNSNNQGFPPPEEKANSSADNKTGTFRIKVNGIWEFNDTLGNAKFHAKSLRTKFGNSVSLDKI